jgi:NAD(P)-dependent dehydrogenase (short-subunit alcohol dehydrogenase family)
MGIDILVHAAGITGAQGMFHEIDDQGWVDTLTINLLGRCASPARSLDQLRRNGELPYRAAEGGVLSSPRDCRAATPPRACS